MTVALVPDKTIGGARCITVDGREYLYSGGDTPEELEACAAQTRRALWPEQASGRAVRLVKVADREYVQSWLWEFLETVEPFSVSNETLDAMARMAANNRPLSDFIHCQSSSG